MKKHNLLKGLVSLLALVFVLGAFGGVKASAADEAKKVTFTATVDGEEYTYEVGVPASDSTNVTVAELTTAMELTAVAEIDATKPYTTATLPAGVAFSDGTFTIDSTAGNSTVKVKVYPKRTVTFTTTYKGIDFEFKGEFSEGKADAEFDVTTASTGILDKLKEVDGTLELKNLHAVLNADAAKTAYPSTAAVKFTEGTDSASAKFTVTTKAKGDQEVKLEFDVKTKSATFTYTDKNSVAYTTVIEVPYILGDEDLGPGNGEENFKLDVDTVWAGLKNGSGSTAKALSTIEPDCTIESITYEKSGTKNLYPFVKQVDGENVTDYATMELNLNSEEAVPDYTVQITEKFIASFSPETGNIEITKVFPRYDKVYYLDCKNADGIQATDKGFKSLAVKDGEATLSLSDSKKGLKIAETKDTYVFLTVDAPVKTKTDYAANVVVEKAKVSKLALTFDYSKANPAKGIEGEVLSTSDIYASFNLTDGAKNKLTVTPDVVATKEATVLNNFNTLVENLEFSIDNKTWGNVADGVGFVTTVCEAGSEDASERFEAVVASTGTAYTKTPATVDVTVERVGEELVVKCTPVISGLEIKYNGDEVISSSVSLNVTVVPEYTLNTADLYTYITDSKYSKGLTIYFRVAGTEADDDVNASRPSPVAKVKTKASGKATDIKLDIAKNLLLVKNGYDYAVLTVPEKAANEDDSYQAVPYDDEWITVLPQNKKGTAADNKGVAIIEKPTASYAPVKFSEATAAAFTSVKVAGLDVADLFARAQAKNNGAAVDTIYVHVRKSAAVGKPASLSKCFTIAKPVAAPVLTVVTDKTYVGVDEVTTADGTLTGEIKLAGITKNEAAENGFEYIIVKKADLANIDWAKAKWSKFDATKALKYTKLKCSGYVLKGETAKVTDEYVTDGNFLILIRSVGKKGKNANDSKLASEYVKTTIKTTKADKTVEWQIVQ